MTDPRPAVTVAAVIERDGRYLLVEEETRDGLRLNNPAGHLEPGETPLQGVVREVLEETACAFLPQALVGVYLARGLPHPDGSRASYLRLAYTGVVGEPDEALALDAGIVRRVWLTLDEIRASTDRHRSPLVLRNVLDHAAGRRFPVDLVYTDPGVWG